MKPGHYQHRGHVFVLEVAPTGRAALWVREPTPHVVTRMGREDPFDQGKLLAALDRAADHMAAGCQFCSPEART